MLVGYHHQKVVAAASESVDYQIANHVLEVYNIQPRRRRRRRNKLHTDRVLKKNKGKEIENFRFNPPP
jgi:hypothetical protein